MQPLNQNTATDLSAARPHRIKSKYNALPNLSLGYVGNGRTYSLIRALNKRRLLLLILINVMEDSCSYTRFFIRQYIEGKLNFKQNRCTF